MTLRILAALFAATCASTSIAYAQTAAVSLQPADAATWDVTLHAGWFGGNKSDIGPDWDNWYEAAAGGVSAGYYLTPHVKLEADVFTTTTGDIYSQEQIAIPGATFPYFQSRQHYFRVTAVSAAAHYQFLENTWFHPFVGGGLETVRETSRVETPVQFLPPSRTPGPPTLIAGPATERGSDVAVRPFVTAGFKWYVTPRAFIRGEIRSSWSTAHADTVVWRGGVGVDF